MFDFVQTAVFLTLFSLGLWLLLAGYMIVNGLSLQTPDEYGRGFPIGVCLAATIVYLVAAGRCRWEEMPEEGPVDLD